MLRAIEFRWVVIVSCLFVNAVVVVDADEPPLDATTRRAAKSGSTVASDRLSVRIELDEAQGGPKIDVDAPLRVVLTNNSETPISIRNPRTEKGYYDLTFQFTHLRSGKKYLAHKTVVPGHMFSAEGTAETIAVAPGASLTHRESFGGVWGEYRTWTGLPDPNSGDRYEVVALFESAAGANDENESVWTGKIQSEPVTVSFVAPRLVTPHDYLRSGYPGKAIEIMKGDRTWISRRDDNQCTPLHHAARFGHPGAVKWLLEHGADVNAIAYNGFTPLHLTDNPDVIALILQHRPDLTIRCRISGQTPLQRAAGMLVRARSADQEKKWRGIVELYRRAGADYDLQTAIHLDDLQRVKAILAESPALADRGGSQDRSPLRVAASFGRLEICRYLVANFQVDVNDFKRGIGYPIIKEAVAFPEVVRLLIEHGADLKTRITWRGGRTGVWVVGDDATMLHYAASDGVPETVRLLIDKGVDIFDAAHSDGDDEQTALEVAAIFGKADNASAILMHPKFAAADPAVRQTLLDRCLGSGVAHFSFADDAKRILLVNLFLEQGANPNTLVNLFVDPDAAPKDVTVMQAAALQIHPEQEEENRRFRHIVALLKKHGASVDLFTAVAVGDETEVARLLKDDPQSASSRGPDGYPALHVAVGMNYREILKALLAAGCDVDIRNRSEIKGEVDETALHCAAFWGRDDLAKLLIDAGADVNALTERKSTPLHDAARMGSVKIAKLLLEHGAKPDARDNEGETPLDSSRELRKYRVDDIDKLFRDHGQN